MTRHPATAAPVASFDVFDTVLVRSVGNPETVFLLLGRRLVRQGRIACTPEAFTRARKAANRSAYARAGRDGQVTAATIGAELGALLGLEEADSRAITSEELALEAELLRPSPVGRLLVADARARGQRIAYVSDMYLPASFLGQQLRRHGLLRDGDHLYVSSEYPASKGSGKLYSTLAATEGVPVSAVVHHGNDRSADVAGAWLAGARPRLVSDGNLNRYERLLCSTPGADGLASMLAGASRLARLGVPVGSPREAAIRDVAAGVAAPTLTGYVHWVLARAQQRGLERLFFLSRDGQVLHEIACRLAPRLGLALDLRYRHASREAWNLASLTDGGPPDLSWVLTHSNGASARSLLQRLGVMPEEVREILSQLGVSTRSWSRPLGAASRAELLRVSLRPPLRDLVRRRAAERRVLLRDYLRQEGLLDGPPAGLVDVVACGSQHRTACMLARAEGVHAPIAFYAGRGGHNQAPSSADDGRDLVETYLFDEQRSLGRPSPTGGVPLLLVFCTADHGSVVGYQRRGSQVVPILRSPRNEPALGWGLPLLRRAVLAFVDAVTIDVLALDGSADVRSETLAVLEHFWSHPSRVEAAAWGDFPFEYGSGLQVRWSRLGEPYGWPELLARAVGHGTGRRWSWPAGGVANSRLDIRLGVCTAEAAVRVGRAGARRVAREVLASDGRLAATVQRPARRLLSALGPGPRSTTFAARRP